VAGGAALFGILSLVIGRGPSTPDKFSSVIMIVVGVVCVVGALAPGTRLRGAFSHGKGRSVPIGSAGRAILLIASLVMFIEALRGLTQ
jgi:hypothetical protein